MVQKDKFIVLDNVDKDLMKIILNTANKFSEELLLKYDNIVQMPRMY